ncbi:MAG: ABC transporter ATP-binding protein [Planctomycetota bacterium]|jgi:ABC-type polysaccharide/polyol phosphate transport system ATPase subunit
MSDTGSLRAIGIGVRYRLAREELLTLKAAVVRAFRPRRRVESWWALRQVSFDVAPGEAVAIFGGNGAGKSTLLRVLGGILPPAEGRVELGGTVLPLIEMAAGFLPDLTANENILLNGTVLGQRRAAVERLRPAILDYAGLTEFAGVPVRNFSTGMFSRLAFALAAHLPSDILLIDEVLAVGDQSFRERCSATLAEFRAAGRTIVMATHAVAAAEQLCERAIILADGAVQFDGPIAEAIPHYRAMKQPPGTPPARPGAPPPPPA